MIIGGIITNNNFIKRGKPTYEENDDCFMFYVIYYRM